MSFKCKIGLHSWDGCKCSECGKTRDEQHDWSKDCEECSKCAKTRENQHVLKGCKCSKCGSEKHDWNLFICSNCGTVDYLGLLKEMYLIAELGNILIGDKNLSKSISINELAVRELSGYNSEVQKQELVVKRFNYLVNVVKQSYTNTGIKLATRHLLDIQETINKLALKHKKNKLY